MPCHRQVSVFNKKLRLQLKFQRELECYGIKYVGDRGVEWFLEKFSIFMMVTEGQL